MTTSSQNVSYGLREKAVIALFYVAVLCLYLFAPYKLTLFVILLGVAYLFHRRVMAPTLQARATTRSTNKQAQRDKKQARLDAEDKLRRRLPIIPSGILQQMDLEELKNARAQYLRDLLKGYKVPETDLASMSLEQLEDRWGHMQMNPAGDAGVSAAVSVPASVLSPGVSPAAAA